MLGNRTRVLVNTEVQIVVDVHFYGFIRLPTDFDHLRAWRSKTLYSKFVSIAKSISQ